jgi:Cu/Ag efflux protein CusF
MRTRLGLVAMALTLALGQGVMLLPARSATAAEQTSEVVEGVVTKIDHDRSRVTIRSSDGTVFEFEASAETLKDMKVGDRIEARRRPAET